MPHPLRLLACVFIAAVSIPLHATESPTEWIDPDTGHRIIRLSEDPGTASPYFNENGYTPDGSRLVVTTAQHGLAAIDLRTRAVIPLVAGPVSFIVVGHKSGDVYYIKREGEDRWLYATNVETRATRRVLQLTHGMISAINADETLGAGVYYPGQEEDLARFRRAREERAATNAPAGERPNAGGANPTFQARYQAKRADGTAMPFAEAKDLALHNRLMAIRQGPPRTLFTVDLATGAIKDVVTQHEWLNHVQFSPTDPHQLMFCHEGTWHEVDRIWLVRTDGTGLTDVHHRTMNMEIAGHEFFSHDGKTVWYDLQTPRGEDFWVAGYGIATGKRTWYHLQRNQWSVHFNVSTDGTLFCGDGGDPDMVAHAPDGKWIYLFTPHRVPDVAGIKNPDSAHLIDSGYFTAERLVNLSRQNYQLEPNVSFTPDMKWIIFRSNLSGLVQTYAVEVAKAR